MAYRCPVCEDPQADAEHLANHLAFTAVIRGGDHESWLDDHVPDWGDDDPEALAARLRDLDAVESVEHPIDEVQTADHAPHGTETNAHTPRRPGAGQNAHGSDSLGGETHDLDDEAREILARARELTRQIEDDERD